MSNARIQQLITLFYMHKTLVESNRIKKNESLELQKIIRAIDEKYEHFKSNQEIKKTFDFLKLVIDSWFKNI